MYVYQLKPSRRQSIWILSWIIGIPLLYSLYDGNKPEYYYSIQFPVWLFPIISLIAAQTRKLQLILLFILLSLNLIASWRIVNAQNPQGLAEQLQIANFINRLPPNGIIYHMPHASNAGLEYLIQQNAATTSSVIVEYPKNPRNVYIFETKHFGIMP